MTQPHAWSRGHPAASLTRSAARLRRLGPIGVVFLAAFGLGLGGNLLG